MQQEDQTHRTQVLTCLNLWFQITWTIISNHGCESPANAGSENIKHKINFLDSLRKKIHGTVNTKNLSLITFGSPKLEPTTPQNRTRVDKHSFCLTDIVAGSTIDFLPASKHDQTTE